MGPDFLDKHGGVNLPLSWDWFGNTWQESMHPQRKGLLLEMFFNIREPLSIHSDCVWAPSINVINTESTSPCLTVVLRSVGSEHTSLLSSATAWSEMLWRRQVCVPIMFHFSIFYSLQPEPGAALNYSGFSVFNLTLLLPGLVQLVKLIERHCGSWWTQSPLLLIQNTCVLLQFWWQYFCHSESDIKSK